MTTRATRLLTALLAAAIVLAACGDDGATSDTGDTTGEQVDDTTTATSADDTSTSTTETTAPEDAGTVVEVTVSGGTIEGPDDVEVDQGTSVTLVVTSDIDDELHVHGYELVADVTAAESVQLAFVADLPGVYEVELHEGGLLFELAVS